MKQQKDEILRHVQDQKRQGKPIQETLAALEIKRSTYYRWRKPVTTVSSAVRVSMLTPEERKKIEDVKEQHPAVRHRQIQGLIQGMGLYVSPSSVYQHLKSLGKVEPYERRVSPWDVPRYEPRQKNMLWGTDWSRLKIGWLRWYLLAVIDYFSRVIVAFDIVPSVNAGHIKRVYQMGLKAEGIVLNGSLPELRVDRGSPNTAYVTREFFEAMGAELSYSRVNRPTDNARTERFFGTVKQEEIYVVGNYPDELTARGELGQYIHHYHHVRPHQGLWNFTPAYVHRINNKSQILQELKRLKEDSREKRKAYWQELQHNKNALLNSSILSHS